MSAVTALQAKVADLERNSQALQEEKSSLYFTLEKERASHSSTLSRLHEDTLTLQQYHESSLASERSQASAREASLTAKLAAQKEDYEASLAEVGERERASQAERATLTSTLAKVRRECSSHFAAFEEERRLVVSAQERALAAEQRAASAAEAAAQARALHIALESEVTGLRTALNDARDKLKELEGEAQGLRAAADAAAAAAAAQEESEVLKAPEAAPQVVPPPLDPPPPPPPSASKKRASSRSCSRGSRTGKSQENELAPLQGRFPPSSFSHPSATSKPFLPPNVVSRNKSHNVIARANIVRRTMEGRGKGAEEGGGEGEVVVAPPHTLPTPLPTPPLPYILSVQSAVQGELNAITERLANLTGGVVGGKGGKGGGVKRGGGVSTL